MEVFELLFTDEQEQGVNAISVVASPAMESTFIALSKHQEYNFAKDSQKQILLGIVLKPEKRILRIDPDTNGKFEVFFSKETVRRISEVYLKKGNHTTFNLEHTSENPLSGYISESWIVEDKEKDKSALYNLGAEVGDWVVALKFDDKSEFEKAKENGTGFSIEGLFKEKLNLNKNVMDFEKFKSELLEGFKAIFNTQSVKLGMVKLADGTGEIEFEGEMLMAGASVSLVTPEGNVPLPTGEYELEGGKMLRVVEDGKASEIMDKEPVKEEMSDDIKSQLKDLVANLAVEFKKEFDPIKSELAEVKKKLAEAEKANADLKIELSNAPAVPATNISPFEKSSTVELSKMSKSERLQYTLNQVKN